MRVAILASLLLGVASLTLPPSAYGDTVKLSSSPDCVSWGQDRIDCVAKGVDSALWHDARISGSWHGWESLGGVLTSGPSITSWGPGRLDMFARGGDNALWHIMWDGAFHQWERLGGILTSDPDCTSIVTDIVDCFVRGADNALWHIRFKTGTWSNWESLGGILTSGPGGMAFPGTAGEPALNVFVRGADNALWEISRPSDAWGKWLKWGGTLTSDPDAVGSRGSSNGVSSSHIDIVVRGTDNGIWWKWAAIDPISMQWTFSGGCLACGYESLGGVSIEGPSIASRGWNNGEMRPYLDLFALGTDNNLYHRGWDGATWSPWDAVPMTLAPATATTSSPVVSVSSQSSTVLTSSTIVSSSTVFATSTVLLTSSQPSSTTTASSIATSITSMEASSATATSQPTNINFETPDLTEMLQQNGVLIIGVIVLIMIVLVFALRARQKRIGSQKPQ